MSHFSRIHYNSTPKILLKKELKTNKIHAVQLTNVLQGKEDIVFVFVSIRDEAAY